MHPSIVVFQNELKQVGLTDKAAAASADAAPSNTTAHLSTVPATNDVSQASEDVFVDAVSEQSSIYEDTSSEPARAAVNTPAAITTMDAEQRSDVSTTGLPVTMQTDSDKQVEQQSADDVTDATVMKKSHEPPDVETSEADEPAKKVPKVLEHVQPVSIPVPDVDMTQ